MQKVQLSFRRLWFSQNKGKKGSQGPPYEIWCRAVDSGAFAEVDAVGSLRALRRTGPGT